MHFHPKEWSWINHTFSRMTFFVPASFLPLCSCHHQPIKSWIGPGFTPRPWDWGRVNGCEQTPKHWLLMKADSRLSMWIIFFLNNTKRLENVWVYLHTSLIWSINWLYFCSRVMFSLKILFTYKQTEEERAALLKWSNWDMLLKPFLTTHVTCSHLFTFRNYFILIVVDLEPIPGTLSTRRENSPWIGHTHTGHVP